MGAAAKDTEQEHKREMVRKTDGDIAPTSLLDYQSTQNTRNLLSVPISSTLKISRSAAFNNPERAKSEMSQRSLGGGKGAVLKKYSFSLQKESQNGEEKWDDSDNYGRTERGNGHNSQLSHLEKPEISQNGVNINFYAQKQDSKITIKNLLKNRPMTSFKRFKSIKGI